MLKIFPFSWADVHAVDLHLPVLGQTEGVLQVHMPLPDGLDLGPGQLNARLVLILDEVIVIGLAVLGNDLDALGVHPPPSSPDRLSAPL